MQKKGTVLITGASSGIGAEYAKQLAAKGYDLILGGRRKKLLQTLVQEIKQNYKVSVKTFFGDLSFKEELLKLAKLAKKEKNLVGLINNAGFGIKESLLKTSFEEKEKMINVHIKASTYLIDILLERLLQQKSSFIINVSSLAALLATPGSPVYAATKSYLNTFSESLLASCAKKGLKVQALCPGFTKTDFHLRLGVKAAERKNKGLVRWMSSQQVVKYSLKKLAKKKVIVVPGFFNRLALFLVKLAKLILGGFYYKLAAKVAQNIKGSSF